MRTKIPIVVILITMGAAPLAHADLFGVYAQGHGGAADMDGASDRVLGAELGVNLLLFQAYVGLDDDLGHGNVRRAIVSFRSSADVVGWNLSVRAGGGWLWEDRGVFGTETVGVTGINSNGLVLGNTMAPATDRSGPVARIGLALDHGITPGLALGFGVDGEYFAIKPPDDAVVNANIQAGTLSSTVHTGFDVLASLHLKFELGI
jgi:hypothetical protein